MADKIIVTPGKVRGLGNIVSERSKADYEKYHSAVAVGDSDDTIPSNIYVLKYDLGGIVLTVSSQLVNAGGTVTVTATLTGSNGNPISGESINFYKEG